MYPGWSWLLWRPSVIFASTVWNGTFGVSRTETFFSFRGAVKSVLDFALVVRHVCHLDVKSSYFLERRSIVYTARTISFYEGRVLILNNLTKRLSLWFMSQNPSLTFSQRYLGWHNFVRGFPVYVFHSVNEIPRNIRLFKAGTNFGIDSSKKRIVRLFS